MVGAQRSNRCETCRRRKVKCDEAWPICGQCKVGNRICPARPALRIVDEGHKVLRQHGPTPELRENPDLVFSLASPSTTRLVKLSDSLRRGSHRNPYMNHFVPLSQSEQLCLSFIDSLQLKNPSLSLRTLGGFVWEIPRYLGSNKALDGAIACVLASQKHLLLNDGKCLVINSQLYNRALHNLRIALLAPQACYTSDTLAATVMMHRVEALFGKLPNTNVKVHAAGLAALHKQRGPPDPYDKLGFQATMDSHISIIQLALSERKDCFLASEAWSAVLDRPNQRKDVQTIYYRLMRLMTIWPTLARENFEVWEGLASTNANLSLRRARCVLEHLTHIDHDMSEVIWGQSKLTTTRSSKPDGLTRMSFHVEDPLAAMLLCHFATYSIIVHRIAVSLMQKTSGKTEQPKDFRDRILYQCQRIWMLLDYSCSSKPLGLPMMTAALLFTYEPAQDSASRRDIIVALNELDCGRMGTKTWSAEGIGRATAALLGSYTGKAY